jgi:hypothetical protein
MIRRGVKGAGATLLVVAALGAAVAAFAAGEPKRCNPAGSVTLAQSRQARAYQLRPGRKQTLYGCAYSTGRPYALAAPGFDGAYAFPPPAIKVTGPVVAFAWDDHEDVTTYVSVVDVRHDPIERVSPNSAAPAEGGGHFTYVKVGSLQLGASGTVVWVACPEDPDKGNPTASPRPGCRHPGRRDTVWALRHDRRPKVRLDRGRSIDPSSLTRRGTRYCWIRGGRRRCKRVP